MVRFTVECPDFAAYMRLCMEVDGLSGDQVASSVGVSSRMVSYWRTGGRVPALGQVRHLVRAIPTMRAEPARELQAAARTRVIEVAP